MKITIEVTTNIVTKEATTSAIFCSFLGPSVNLLPIVIVYSSVGSMGAPGAGAPMKFLSWIHITFQVVFIQSIKIK